MKRTKLSIILIAIVASSTTIAGIATSLLPRAAFVTIYVRRDESTPPTSTCPLISAGTYDLTLTGSGIDITVLVDDKRTTATNDTRKGRSISDVVLKTATATTCASNVVIPATPCPPPIAP